MDDLRARLQDIFRDVFEDDELVLRDEMTAGDVDGWDSLAHINLIIAVEKALRVRFAAAEIARLKESSQNVGTFLRLVEGKLKGASGQ